MLLRLPQDTFSDMKHSMSLSFIARWWGFKEYSVPDTCTPMHSWSSESSHMADATNILDSLS